MMLACPVGVYVVDHGGQGCGLARPGRAGHQDKAPLFLGQARDHRRQARGRWPTARSAAPAAAPGPASPAGGRHCSGSGPRPLTESEKSASPVVLNSSSRSGGRTTWTSSSHSSCTDRRERRHPQVAVDAHPRGRTDLDVQVGGALFDDVTEDGR